MVRVIATVVVLLAAQAAAAMSRVTASNPAVQWRGRYRQNYLDESCSFDWAGVEWRFSVVTAATASMRLQLTGADASMLRVFVDGVDTGRLLVNASQEVYTLVAGLDPSPGLVHNISVTNTIEPAFIYSNDTLCLRGADQPAGQQLPPDVLPAPTLLSVSTDGSFAAPTPAFGIKMLFVGDEVTSGNGAAGEAPCSPGLDTNDYSSTYAAMLCTYFSTECIGTVAWSGRGLVENARPGGPPLPPSMLQTLGAAQGAQDWDWNRPSRPDAVVINLGTNDFCCGRDGNATFTAQYVAAYVAFVATLTNHWLSGYPTLFLMSGPMTRAYEQPLLEVIQAAQAQYNVRSDGSGQFSSIQAALSFCNASTAGPSGSLGHVTLHIQGKFRERVTIIADFPGGVTIIGDGATPLDNLIVYNTSGADGMGTFSTHTLLVQAAGVTLINAAVANDAGHYNAAVAAQSVALHIDPTGDKFACFGCALLGAQDTVYTGCTGYGLKSYFFDTYSNGTCDAWFGGSSTVLEQNVIDMNTTVTAARGEPGSAYLILDSQVLSRGGVLLGRPWGQMTTTVFKSCYMEGVSAVGWDDWSHGCTKAKPGSTTWCSPLLYAEYNSTGPAAGSQGRAWWSKQLTAQEAAVWTPTYALHGWVPTEGLHPEALRALRKMYPL